MLLFFLFRVLTLGREVLVDDMKHLQFPDDITLNAHRLSEVNEEERPKGVDVCGEDVSDPCLLGHLVEVIPIEVVKLVHKVNAILD